MSTTPTAPIMPESAELRELRAIKTAVVFLAWLFGITAAAGIILGIIIGVQVHKLDTSVNGGGSTSCMSLGGSDPSC